MSNIERLYLELLDRRIVSFSDIANTVNRLSDRHLSSSHIYDRYIDKMLKRGLIKRIRRGLYEVTSSSDIKTNVDKFLVASKIKSNYFLGFHTALEFYGCAYSSYREAYICVRSKDRFDKFSFSQISFRPIFVENINDWVEEHIYRNQKIKVSSKERTFVDCLSRISYAGGWEECLKSLQNLSGLNFDKIVNITVAQGSQILIRRVGYVLELLKSHSIFFNHLPEKILRNLESKIMGQSQYLIRRRNSLLNARWRIYVPLGFEDYLRGI